MTRRLAWSDEMRCKFDLIRLIRMGQSGLMPADFGSPPSTGGEERILLHILIVVGGAWWCCRLHALGPVLMRPVINARPIAMLGMLGIG